MKSNKWDKSCILGILTWLVIVAFLATIICIIFINTIAKPNELFLSVVGSVAIALVLSFFVMMIVSDISARIQRRRSKTTNNNGNGNKEEKTTNKTPKPNIPVEIMSPIQYEEYVAEYMRFHGYINVYTTKATNDYGADILMHSRNGKKICIQCKRYKNPVGYKAVQEVYSAKAYYNCDEAWVCSTNGFTKNAQEGARKIGVKLLTIK